MAEPSANDANVGREDADDDRERPDSRRDLRRLNAWMHNHAIMANALQTAVNSQTPKQIIELGSGELVGELAMLAPDNKRTATLECIAPGRVLSITYEEVEQLYYQNPTFGFYFLRLATARLLDNISRLEAELMGQKVSGA